MHSMARKVLEMHLCLHECHLKREVESEVDVYLKVVTFVRFQLCGMFCHVSVTKECSVEVNKFSSFCRTGKKLKKETE